MIRAPATVLATLALLSAVPGIAAGQQNSLVGTWRGTYTFPASAPPMMANRAIDDELVLTPQGRFTETERAKSGAGAVVSGSYTLLRGNVLHLAPETVQPQPRQPLSAEDYHYRFTGPNQLAVNYEQVGPDGRPIPIQETLTRAR